MKTFTNPSIFFTALNYLNVFAIKYNKSSDKNLKVCITCSILYHSEPHQTQSLN